MRYLVSCSEMYVLSLPVYMLMHEKVQSEEQQIMMQQQLGAAREFRAGVFTSVSIYIDI